jgi:type IV secretion system protein VirD4
MMFPKKKDVIDLIFPIFGIAVVVILCLHMAVAYDSVSDTPRIKANGEEVFNGPAFFQAFGERIESSITAVQVTKSTPAFLGGGMLICFIAWAYMTTARRKFIKGKEYGTSEWGKLKDISYLFAVNQLAKAIKDIKKKKGLSQDEKKRLIEEAKIKYEDADMLFTRTERICMYNYELNNNTLIIGGSGSGKTRGFVLPNILQAHASYVVTDPKGEILEKAGKFLADVKGYKVRVLNLDEMKLSDGYNPFHYIRMDRDGWEERVLTLIDTIIINTDGGEKRASNDPFWEKAERLFLQALFFATMRGFPDE